MFSVAVGMLTASVIWIAAGISPAVSDASPKSPQPSSAAGSGEPGTVRLTPDQQHQIGLQTVVLEAAHHPEQLRAYGAVLDVARITELTNSYANSQAQLQTAQASFDVAKSASNAPRTSFSLQFWRERCRSRRRDVPDRSGLSHRRRIAGENSRGDRAAGMGLSDWKGDRRALTASRATDRTRPVSRSGDAAAGCGPGGAAAGRARASADAECQYRSPLRLASNPNRGSDSGTQLLLCSFGRQ